MLANHVLVIDRRSLTMMLGRLAARRQNVSRMQTSNPTHHSSNAFDLLRFVAAFGVLFSHSFALLDRTILSWSLVSRSPTSASTRFLLSADFSFARVGIAIRTWDASPPVVPFV
jgi:hypothetical protein